MDVLQRCEVTAKLIQPGAQADPGAVQEFGVWWVPSDHRALNGESGIQSGQVELKLWEEGTATLLLPNTTGPDGRLHRERFLYFTDLTYRPGDEWIEIWRSDAEDTAGGPARPLFVGTPISDSRSPTQIELRLEDPQRVLKKTRETAAGFWAHAPRDVWEHYTQGWRVSGADDFADSGDQFPAVAGTGITPDGRWGYGSAKRAAGAVRLQPPPSTNAYLQPAYHELDLAATHRPWRVEAVWARSKFNPGAELRMSLGIGTQGLNMRVSSSELICVMGGSPDVVVATGVDSGEHIFAIEGRGRWVYFYYDSTLVCVLPLGSSGGRKVEFQCFGSPTGGEWAEVRSVISRQHQPLLLRGSDKGDYRLPGTPPVGGLVGSYFNDQDLVARHGSNSLGQLLAPTREPGARRLDDNPGGGSAGALAALPQGVLGENFSVRWVGAIYLNLAAGGYNDYIQTLADDRVRVWIGKTRFGEQIINDWPTNDTGLVTTTSGSLRAHLGGQSGWYPIVIEYMNAAGSGGLTLLLEQFDSSLDGGYPSTVSADLLSPLGIFERHVTGESHYEMLQQLSAQYGYQATVEPMQLQSGEFPGRLAPRVRVGRDRDKRLSLSDVDQNAIDVQVSGSAEDVADSLVGEGAGIAADGAQLTVEHINFPEVERHAFLAQESESLSDITIEANMRQRLATLLGLRQALWEEVQAKPVERRDYVDSFPLTGALARFAWGIGDGILLDFPEVGVVDGSGRQLTTVTWPFVPHGLGAPEVGLRQRPRNFRQLLRQMQRAIVAPQRNYQGQLTTVNGSQGFQPPSASGEQYTRASLPADRSKIVKAELVVGYKQDASTMTIEIMGVARSTFARPGRYDITPWATAPGDQRLYARATGGTGSSEYQLELLVAI